MITFPLPRVLRAALVPVASFVGLALVLGAVGSSRTIADVAAQDTEDLIAYERVDQWPRRGETAEGLFQQPIDLDVMASGRVFIADPGIGGVHLLMPSGVFTKSIGATGGFPEQLARVGPIAVGPDPNAPGFPMGGERLYVLDTSMQRVAIYDADGQFVETWPDVNATGIAASSDGRVYVFDQATSLVRALDARTGDERFTFGTRGFDDGQFANFDDMDVSPDGRVLAVGDRFGLRLQLFDLASDDDLAGDSPPPPSSFRRSYDLTQPKYTQNDYTCRAGHVNAMGGDEVFIGEANSACIVDGTSRTFAIAVSAASRTICKDKVTLPRVKAGTQQFYALAESDPNSGKCGSKRTDLDTVPVVVKYGDNELRGVETVWQAASNEDAENPLLFAPSDLSMPEAGVVFVADSSPEFRFFSREGDQLAMCRRGDIGGHGAMSEAYNLLRATGSDALGEVFAYYIHIRPGGPMGFQVEAGVGRFETLEKQTQTGLERVIEPMWTDVLVSSMTEVDIPGLNWNPVSGELLVLVEETVPQQRTVDVRLARYTPDGESAGPSFDLPDDGQVNPYIDFNVGLDGRIFALDSLANVVRVFAADGTPETEVPVVFDARAVAGGPASADGSVFVLREPGAIERYTSDGTVTARIDGRPLPFSDPTTLTDLVVDADGRVYVADSQSSLISVFEAKGVTDVLPVPADGTCAFCGDAEAVLSSLPLGASTTVTMTLEGICGIKEEPADIVVVVPYFLPLEQGTDPSAGSITDLINLVSRVDFGKHRAGIVSYFNTVTTELALTGDRDAYIEAARDVRRFRVPNENVRANLKAALEEADELFEADEGRRKVIVLIHPDYCSAQNEFFPGQCAGYVPAEETALALQDAGASIVVVDTHGAMHLASTDEDVIFGAENAHRRMVRYGQPESLATDLTLTSTIPGNMTVDPAGISPGGGYNPPDVVWRLDELDFLDATFALRLSPTEAGTWPTSSRAVARLTDGWGAEQEVGFAIPEVTVFGDAPTPTPPPTVTPEPTGTPEPQPSTVYLPWAANRHCTPVKRKFDMVLVVDVSSSMAADGKIDAARESMRAFVDGVNLGDDRVAIVDFATQATVPQALTDDRAAIDRALDGLATRHGTRIDRGLGAAIAELQSARARPESGKVIVLLSDGQQTEAVDEVHRLGQEARSLGVSVFTIGLGEGADDELLTAVGTNPSHYYYAPDKDDLREIYERIRQTITGCP